MIDLGRDWLRDRLASTTTAASPLALLAGDEGRSHGGELPRTPAAVLVGIVARPAAPALLLTQRTAHLRDHAGQISLPGGRIEPDDVDAVAAALREAREEIGLAPERVEVLGELDTYDTGTGFRIHPVVGWIEPPIELVPDPFEVADVFELPLDFLLDEANHRRDSHLRNGMLRQFYVLPYADRYIWGATAGILINFAHRLGDIPA